jgi:NAD(P)-dependent dehydrogenase (short-subunit alcohol dehydrogenase family)
VKHFQGRVAVITGAASGIGRAIAQRCARSGMHVVLADMDEAALSEAEAALTGQDATVLAVKTDVSKRSDVEDLARRAFDTFGQVHLLHAIRGFIESYCSEPRLAFNKTVVTRYRISLEQRHYASTTINLRQQSGGWHTRPPIAVCSVQTWLPVFAA